MRVSELKALAREHGLRGYSWLRNAEIIERIRNGPGSAQRTYNQQGLASWASHIPLRNRTTPLGGVQAPRPLRPTQPNQTQSVRFRPDRPRQPSLQEMDIFEQQEMSKSRPQVKSKLNDWYDWLVNHVPSTIKDGTSRAFKTFKNKIMGLYNRVTGSTANLTQLKGSRRLLGPTSRSAESEPIELEQAFNGAYRSYRVNGRPKMDVDMFLNRIRKGLIELIKREPKTRTSARIQTTTWIRFAEDEDRIDKAFNSLMTSVYRGNDLDQIVDRMIANMKFQIENPVLLNSRFVFDEDLYLDVDFHQLNLMRGSSYLPLPDFIAKRKAVIDPQNGDKVCFKWAIIAADKWMEIDSHPERVSNLREFADNYDWSGLEFPVSLKQIGKFEVKNNISVNVLGLEGKDIYILKNSNRSDDREIYLLMISENGINHIYSD